MADLPQLRPTGQPYRTHAGRRVGPPYELHVEGGSLHWIGGECACRPVPATHAGFAGVLHREGDRGGFFEAQACTDHPQHDPAPEIVGVAAALPCDEGPYTGELLSGQEAVQRALRAFDASGLTTLRAPEGES